METNYVLLVLCSIFCLVKPDPDPIHDYCVADTKSSPDIFLNEVPCINPNYTLASHFATSALSQPGDDFDQQKFSIIVTDINSLPGLNTLSLVMTRIDIAGNGLVSPHSHPRASELLILLEGFLLVGFIDTSNRLYRQRLSPGDCFVFPKALVHFLYNVDSKRSVLALSGFNSQNPGRIMLSSGVGFAGNAYPNPMALSESSGEIDQDQWSRCR